MHLLLCCAALTEAASPSRIIVHIPTSDALAVAQQIARDEGYDISDTNMYYFDLLDSGARPLARGYTSMGFFIDGRVRSSISINESTGQILDTVTCELFDYPDLQVFQERIRRTSGAKKKTPEELADEVGCAALKILVTPTHLMKAPAYKLPRKCSFTSDWALTPEMLSLLSGSMIA